MKIRNPFKVTHTVASVARQLAEGLRSGDVVLDDGEPGPTGEWDPPRLSENIPLLDRLDKLPGLELVGLDFDAPYQMQLVDSRGKPVEIKINERAVSVWHTPQGNLGFREIKVLSKAPSTLFGGGPLVVTSAEIGVLANEAGRPKGRMFYLKFTRGVALTVFPDPSPEDKGVVPTFDWAVSGEQGRLEVGPGWRVGTAAGRNRIVLVRGRRLEKSGRLGRTEFSLGFFGGLPAREKTPATEWRATLLTAANTTPSDRPIVRSWPASPGRS